MVFFSLEFIKDEGGEDLFVSFLSNSRKCPFPGVFLPGSTPPQDEAITMNKTYTWLALSQNCKHWRFSLVPGEPCKVQLEEAGLSGVDVKDFLQPWRKWKFDWLRRETNVLYVSDALWYISLAHSAQLRYKMIKFKIYRGLRRMRVNFTLSGTTMRTNSALWYFGNRRQIKLTSWSNHEVVTISWIHVCLLSAVLVAVAEVVGPDFANKNKEKFR